MRRARKEQRRRDEKERRESDCARLREEEQRDGLADNDDSSSTTTEASNPDLELAARVYRLNGDSYSVKICMMMRLHLKQCYQQWSL